MGTQDEIYQTLSENEVDPAQYEQMIAYGQRRGRLARGEVSDLMMAAEYNEDLAGTCMRGARQAGISVDDAQGDPPESYPESAEDAGDLAELEASAAAVDLSGVDADDTLKVYLHEATQTPLLNHAEEVELARGIDTCRAAYQELSRGGVPPARQAKLRRLIQEGESARDRLIRANARLVISVARRYGGRGLPLTDLIQEGNIGLMRAVRNFDFRRGFKFSTYATWWIRQGISRALADQSRTIRLPAYLSDQAARLRRTQTDLQQRLGRDPSHAELAEGMHMPLARVEALIAAMAQPLSLETPVVEGEDSVLGDLLEDPDAVSPEEEVSSAMDRAELRGLVAGLPDRERMVLEMRYGLDGGEPRTLAQVGAALKITRERARQLELQAIDRLRDPERAAQRKHRGPTARA